MTTRPAADNDESQNPGRKRLRSRRASRLAGAALAALLEPRGAVAFAPGYTCAHTAPIPMPAQRTRTHRPTTLARLRLAAAAGAVALAGCATTPPSNPDDLCSVFREKKDWYENAHNAARRWGMPVPIQMAILRQESAFVDDARPPRKRLFGLIPTVRPSSAYGYSQAKDSTWDWYRDKSGNRGADRDDFADAADFVGWYGDMSHRLLGISKGDAYRQYLAYHEGHGGYRRGTYRGKDWLIGTARKVAARADRYGSQLAGCQADLERGGGWWPF
jgi:hypothetical protein